MPVIYMFFPPLLSDIPERWISNLVEHVNYPFSCSFNVEILHLQSFSWYGTLQDGGASSHQSVGWGEKDIVCSYTFIDSLCELSFIALI